MRLKLRLFRPFRVCTKSDVVQSMKSALSSFCICKRKLQKMVSHTSKMQVLRMAIQLVWYVCNEKNHESLKLAIERI